MNESNIQPLDPRFDHHPWCNFSERPREGCKQCDEFYEKFPYRTRDTFDILQERHFPEAVLRRR